MVNPATLQNPATANIAAGSGPNGSYPLAYASKEHAHRSLQIGDMVVYFERFGQFIVAETLQVTNVTGVNVSYDRQDATSLFNPFPPAFRCPTHLARALAGLYNFVQRDNHGVVILNARVNEHMYVWRNGVYLGTLLHHRANHCFVNGLANR